MGVVISKVLRMARHAFLSNSFVYQSRRKRLSRMRADEALPTISEARACLLSLRPPLNVPPPVFQRAWPDSPKYDISVIVPCYNVERYVRQALRSVFDQVCDATFEVIAIDDGSTDKTPEILDELAASDCRLTVIHQLNSGFSGARNTGIEAAKGSSFVFLDSDDMLVPGALQTLHRALTSTGSDYITARYAYIDESGRRLPTPSRRPAGVPWGRIFNREVWRELGFPDGLWFEDTVHAYLIAPRFSESTIDRVVCSYRKLGTSITSTSRLNKRSVDTYFATEAMLAWRDAIGLPVDQVAYEQTLYQLGPLLANRTAALSDWEMKCCFVVASNLLNSLGGVSNEKEFRKMAGFGVCSGWQRL